MMKRGQKKRFDIREMCRTANPPPEGPELLPDECVPQYFVTAPVFAQAMQQMHKQMVIGDRLQEKQWLESEIDRLKNKKLAIYDNAGGTFTAVETQAIRDIDEDIACKTRRIESINMQMQNNWMKGE